MRNPQVEDVDGDGIKDMIAVANNNTEVQIPPAPTINYWKRNANGSIDQTKYIQANGQYIFGIAVAVFDWNGDGKFDLIVNYNKSLRLYLNTGSTTQYLFTSYTELMADGVKLSYDSTCLHTYDFNKDGKKDLIVGVKGPGENRIYFLENIGTSTSPILKKGVLLVTTDNKPITISSVLPSYKISLYYSIADLNGDGNPDIIVADWEKAGSLYDVVFRMYLGQNNSGISQKTEESSITHSRIYWNSMNKNVTITLSSNNKQAVDFKIISTNGKVVKDIFENTFKENTVTLNLHDLVSGTYFIQYTIGNHSYSNKILISR